MSVQQFNPLEDSRWGEFVANHPSASVFHTQGWLEALRSSYGYEPLVLTTTEPSKPLRNGLVLCKVSSWLTGCRLVSLPFSDHCQPLVDDPADLMEILHSLESGVQGSNWKYVELRPLAPLESQALSKAGIAKSESFCFHKLDMRPSLESLFNNFHKTSVLQPLRRAKREAVTIEEGRSETFLRKFYRLLLLTRRRHRLPPQPFSWFCNLTKYLGDRIVIRVASKCGEPIASILTLSHAKTVVYKYGCSDARYHKLGGMPLLFWSTIQKVKLQGFEEFDFGRSEHQNAGLIAFKDHWGGPRTKLTYYRYPPPLAQNGANDFLRELAQQAFARLPDSCLTAIGKLAYRHIG